MADIFLAFLEISVSTSLVVILLISISPFLNKRYAAKWKYWMWIFLAVRLIIPVSGTTGSAVIDRFLQRNTQNVLKSEISNPNTSPEQAAPLRRLVVELPAQITTPIAAQSAESSAGITPMDIAAFVWLSGCLLFIAVHFISYLHYKNQVVKKGVFIQDAAVLDRISELKQELHIKCSVCVVQSPKANSPMIVGFLTPFLILPEEQYSSEELFFVLKHEMVHLKRKDVYVKLLFVVAKAVHWFNPLIWVMQKEAVIDMELSCDERVTQGTDYALRKAYTETLLSSLQKKCAKRNALSTQFYGGASIIKKRFINILYKAEKKNGAVVLACAAVLTVGLGMFIGCSVADGIKSEAVDNDNWFTANIPQDGEIYGYISEFGKDSVTIDRQIWATPESEDWKNEYNYAAGFEVVDAKGGDLEYPFHKDCTYSVLENHYYPVVELDGKAFEKYLSEMEYPVLWTIQLEGGQIRNISEHYVP